MSEHALIYWDEDFAHRHLVIFEAAGMASDFASLLIRTLLSEDCIKYPYTAKTDEGLKTIFVEKEGPTGLITTTTAVSLHPENETRLVSATVNDTRDQTRDVLEGMAAEYEGGLDEPGPDIGRWHALQRWIELGEHRVKIPYASALAREIPPLAVRLRRDFKAILGLISASAILHQMTRERDDRGRIIATIEDYAIVRELVIDLVSEGVEATVKPEVRGREGGGGPRRR